MSSTSASRSHLYSIISPQNTLPLYSSVIFVDWHGVLSRDQFWSSVLCNPSHPYQARLSHSMTKLFGSCNEVTTKWMLNQITSKDIVDLFLSEWGVSNTDKEFIRSQLLGILAADCRKMRVDSRLVGLLSELRQKAFVVLATDNMDCFAAALEVRPKIRSLFDSVICSCSEGVLKSHNPKRFFHPWLKSHGLTFSSAILIDDSISNCQAFRGLGGSAIHANSSADVEMKIAKLIESAA